MEWLTYLAAAVAVAEAFILLSVLRAGRASPLRMRPGRRYMVVLVHGNPSRWELYELDREESPLGLRTRDGFFIYERSPGLIGSEETEPLGDEKYSVFHNDVFGDLVKVEARRPPYRDPEKKVIVVDAYPDPVLKAIRDAGHKDVFDAMMDYVEEAMSRVKVMALRQAKTYMSKMRSFTEQVIEWAETLEKTVEMKSKAKLMSVAGETYLKAASEVSSSADELASAVRGESNTRKKLLGIIEAKMGREMADKLRNAPLDELVDFCLKYKYISEDEAEVYKGVKPSEKE